MRASLGPAAFLFVAAASIAPDRADAAGPSGSGYVEQVVFSVRISEATYGGAVNELYLMVDRYGGRNRLQDARRMTNTVGDRFEITVPLAEGDYIYVFAANPTQYVDLNDPDLNPDDVPDANFFNDPHARFPGYGGQYSTDNVYYVRDPNRPKLDASLSTPKPGALITGSATAMTFRVELGANNHPIDSATLRVRLDRNEPFGIAPGPSAPPPPDILDIPNATFSPTPGGAGGGFVQATLTNPPEGMHFLLVDVKNQDGLESDTLQIPVYINRMNQPPIADAGPSRFTIVGRFVEVDGGASRDPDGVGFSSFTWRKVSGPGNMEIRTISQEPRNDDPAQRRGDGVPVIDGDGNIVGDARPATGAIPQVRFTQPGDYVLGLVVTDREGLPSVEATTTVHVSASYDPAIKLRLHVGSRDGQAIVSAEASDLSNGPLPSGTPLRFIADSLTPTLLTPLPGGNGREVALSSAVPGVYFVHAQAGLQSGAASYPAQAIVKIDATLPAEGRDLARVSTFWRDDAILYLLFIREFADSDGDGEGDIRGAIQKIGWMKELGVNAVWIMPLEPSGTTHGYSTDAFFAVHEDYGSIQDLREFVERAHAAGIRVILDNVLNHTSARHPWFAAAGVNPEAVTRDRYIFRADGSYQYTFQFIGLPDLDYNNPIVRTTAIDRARFWMDVGFDGFRCDVAGFTPMSLWRRIRREVFAKKLDTFMLAEIIPPTQDYIEEQFDALYDPWTYWEMRDAFAGNKAFSAVDGALKAAERYVQDSPRADLRQRLDAADLVRVRYLDNQDEDRFLLLAGESKDRQRVASAVQFSLPGVPLITYGDEVSMIEQRGRMNFDRDPAMLAHYRKYLRIRNANPGLRGQSSESPGNPGNSYARLNSDGDLNASQVLSFLRTGANQAFVVLANRGASSVLGTPVTYYVADDVLSRLPDGPIIMTNHAQPTDVLTVSKTQLRNGHTAQVGSYEVKIYQLATVPLKDSDRDGILDTFDRCVGVHNGEDHDDDFDGVANACDHCTASSRGEDVGLEGCARSAGAPRPAYILDGQVDDEAFLVGDNDGLKLYASFNGKDLYLAMTSAERGVDHVLFLRDSETEQPLTVVPFGKIGQAAARWALIDEGRGDRASWVGPWVGTRVAAAGPLTKGVVETTINLAERFGDTFPKAIAIAGASYASGPGGALLTQVPQQRTAGARIETDELLEYALVLPEILPARSGEADNDAGVSSTRPDASASDELDHDRDGVSDLDDNCRDAKNAEQEDFDGDHRGDACDACPTTTANAPIDASGCEISLPSSLWVAFGDNVTSHQGEGCACSAARPTQRTRGGLAMFLALFLTTLAAYARTLRSTRAPNSSIGGIGGIMVGLLSMSALSACDVYSGGEGLLGADFRLVKGAIRPPSPAIFTRQPIALELVAASLCNQGQDPVCATRTQSSDPVRAFYPGTPVNPASNAGGPVSFRLAIPSDAAVVLQFQTPHDGPSGIGRLVAAVRFPKSAKGTLTDVLNGRIPTPTKRLPDVDLGVVEISVAKSPASDMVDAPGDTSLRTLQVVLGEDDAVNPLATNDADGDGAPDLDDSDDDNDLIPDESDEDANGDGVADAAQSIDALPDTDGDGVADRFQS